jgi:hypothetical protein
MQAELTWLLWLAPKRRTSRSNGRVRQYEPICRSRRYRSLSRTPGIRPAAQQGWISTAVDRGGLLALYFMSPTIFEVTSLPGGYPDTWQNGPPYPRMHNSGGPYGEAFDPGRKLMIESTPTRKPCKALTWHECERHPICWTIQETLGARGQSSASPCTRSHRDYSC